MCPWLQCCCSHLSNTLIVFHTATVSWLCFTAKGDDRMGEVGSTHWYVTILFPNNCKILQVSNQGEKNPDPNKVLLVFLCISNQEWKSHFDLSWLSMSGRLAILILQHNDLLQHFLSSSHCLPNERRRYWSFNEVMPNTDLQMRYQRRGNEQDCLYAQTWECACFG